MINQIIIDIYLLITVIFFRIIYRSFEYMYFIINIILFYKLVKKKLNFLFNSVSVVYS